MAFLLLHANEAVTSDSVNDAVWGAARSRSDNRLPMAVARLRRALEPLNPAGQPLLQTVGNCYILSVGPGDLDADAFRAGVQAGRGALQAAEAERAAELLARALGLWRGQPLAEVAFEDFAQAETRRLEELRQVAIESRIDAELRLGHHRELVGELEALVTEQPTREGLAAQLMLALYRCGRQADALEVYRRTRTHLAEELGLEPGPAMKALQAQVLEQAPSLQPPKSAHAVGPAEPTPMLPADVGTTEPTRKHRKTVTVLFLEIVASSALGAQLDPEALRTLTLRYHELSRATIEAHGGSIQEFAAGAVVATFGVPAVHEDDALRAVRAATEARRELGHLADELNVLIETRAGINTGEAVVGGPMPGEALVIGDVVTAAAWLQQSASGGETLIGPDTYTSLSHAVRAERLDLTARGGSRALVAYRLVELVVGAGRRPSQRRSPLVGRAQELGLVMDAYARTRGERSCQLITLVGPAGVGKSRLLEEAAARFEDATVLTGRCLSYGDGITFWPVIEILRAAADIRDGDSGPIAQRKLATVLAGEADDRGAARLAGILAAVIGLSDHAPRVEESFWALRRLFDAISRRRPLVVAFEDVHWAEPTMLDLIEHVVDMTRDAPLLIVCVARPELLEMRPSWGATRRNAGLLHLEPLTPRATAQLIDNLSPRTGLPGELSARIAAGSEGFPLFVEELIAMLLDEGLVGEDADPGAVSADLATLSVPPTIRALLAARLDGLPPDERRVLELASVVGREFWREAISALAPTEIPGLGMSVLSALVRKDLIVPERSPVIDDDSFRFRHILIRDAAYESVSKAERAELHERFASWLERSFAARLVEVQEIIGYHLEEAHAYKAALGPAPADLAERAALYLTAAGRRALARQDLGAATSLLERALALSPSESPARRELSLDVCTSLFRSSEFERAGTVLRELEREATEAQDNLTLAHTRVGLEFLSSRASPDRTAGNRGYEGDADMAMPEASEDRVGIVRALVLAAEEGRIMSMFAPYQQFYEQSLEHLQTAGDSELLEHVLAAIGGDLVNGPTPVPEALLRVQEIIEGASRDPWLLGTSLATAGHLLAMQGRVREALDAGTEGETILRELGDEVSIALSAQAAGPLLHLVGRLDQAERVLLEADAIFERSSEPGVRSAEQGVRSTILADLALVLVEQGRYDDAERIALRAIDICVSDDFVTLVPAHGALSGVLVHRGDAEAEAEARLAVAVAESTDMLWRQGEAWEHLGEALLAQGRSEEAIEALQTALDRFERKGVTVLAERVRGRLRVNMVDTTAGVDQRSDV